MPRLITLTETLTIPDIHKNRIELLLNYTLLWRKQSTNTPSWPSHGPQFAIARGNDTLLGNLQISQFKYLFSQITNKSHGRLRWFQKWTEGCYRMRRKTVNAMLPITCMSVLLLLLFCYETVMCWGFTYGKKASRTVKLNTNFNSMSDQTHGKNVSILHNCKVRDLKETKWWQAKSIKKDSYLRLWQVN